jgi:hypothetical protein
MQRFGEGSLQTQGLDRLITALTKLLDTSQIIHDHQSRVFSQQASQIIEFSPLIELGSSIESVWNRRGRLDRKSTK